MAASVKPDFPTLSGKKGDPRAFWGWIYNDRKLDLIDIANDDAAVNWFRLFGITSTSIRPEDLRHHTDPWWDLRDFAKFFDCPAEKAAHTEFLRECTEKLVNSDADIDGAFPEMHEVTNMMQEVFRNPDHLAILLELHPTSKYNWGTIHHVMCYIFKMLSYRNHIDFVNEEDRDEFMMRQSSYAKSFGKDEAFFTQWDGSDKWASVFLLYMRLGFIHGEFLDGNITLEPLGGDVESSNDEPSSKRPKTSAQQPVAQVSQTATQDPQAQDPQAQAPQPQDPQAAQAPQTAQPVQTVQTVQTAQPAQPAQPARDDGTIRVGTALTPEQIDELFGSGSRNSQRRSATPATGANSRTPTATASTTPDPNIGPLFRHLNAQIAANGGLFGRFSNRPVAPGLAGATSSGNRGLFGSNNNQPVTPTAAAATTSGSGRLFGGNNNQPAAANSAATTGSGSGGLFGRTNTQPVAPAAAATTPSGSGGLFGRQSNQPAASSPLTQAPMNASSIANTASSTATSNAQGNTSSAESGSPDSAVQGLIGAAQQLIETFRPAMQGDPRFRQLARSTEQLLETSRTAQTSQQRARTIRALDRNIQELTQLNAQQPAQQPAQNSRQSTQQGTQQPAQTPQQPQMPAQLAQTTPATGRTRQMSLTQAMSNNRERAAARHAAGVTVIGNPGTASNPGTTSTDPEPKPSTSTSDVLFGRYSIQAPAPIPQPNPIPGVQPPNSAPATLANPAPVAAAPGPTNSAQHFSSIITNMQSLYATTGQQASPAVVNAAVNPSGTLAQILGAPGANNAGTLTGPGSQSTGTGSQTTSAPQSTPGSQDTRGSQRTAGAMSALAGQAASDSEDGSAAETERALPMMFRESLLEQYELMMQRGRDPRRVIEYLGFDPAAVKEELGSTATVREWLAAVFTPDAFGPPAPKSAWGMRTSDTSSAASAQAQPSFDVDDDDEAFYALADRRPEPVSESESESESDDESSESDSEDGGPPPPGPMRRDYTNFTRNADFQALLQRYG
ncbi:hypothetical protein GGR52DRAFT_394737 [Hypoxylon sp. FL1284]|nr:hypothetical protein GGR52DRAFT_394737 [Hypoxylon sp. FL1284]